MTALRSVMAIVAGLLASAVITIYVVFPVVLFLVKLLSPHGFVSKHPTSLIPLMAAEIAIAAAIAGIVIGFLAPKRADLHALIAGLIPVVGNSLLGRGPALSPMWTVAVVAVWVGIIVLSARWAAARFRPFPETVPSVSPPR
jgi:uncharacterized membrane protein